MNKLFSINLETTKLWNASSSSSNKIESFHLTIISNPTINFLKVNLSNRSILDAFKTVLVIHKCNILLICKE